MWRDGQGGVQLASPPCEGPDLVVVGAAGPDEEVDGHALVLEGVDRVAVGEAPDEAERPRDGLVTIVVVGDVGHDVDRRAPA